MLAIVWLHKINADPRAQPESAQSSTNVGVAPPESSVVLNYESMWTAGRPPMLLWPHSGLMSKVRLREDEMA